jgi:hypothetical protein
MRRAICILALIAGCGGGSSPDVDAAALDARVPIDAVSLDAAAFGVPCGDTMFCDPATSQGCCVDGVAEPMCEPINGLCTGDLTSCDGPEDCGGDICCDYGQGPGCGDAPSCTSDNGGTVICHGACN